MAEISIYNINGKSVGKMELDKKIFDGEVNKAVLYQIVKMYQANLRQGNASTKTRSDVSGGGKKPWKQKGTGRARAGTIRSPLWRGGGIVFGPHPRDYSYSLPKAVKRIALISSLNSKLNDKELIVVDDIKISSPKTKEMAAALRNLKAETRPLLVLDEKNEAISRASRNIPQLILRDYRTLNAYDIIRQHKLVLTQKALVALTKQLVK